MRCERCRCEIRTGSIVCDECGAPVLQNISGFPVTSVIQRRLRSMAELYGEEIIGGSSFIALMMDHLPEFDKERRLLVRAVRAGVLSILINGRGTPEIAIAKAKRYLLGEAFLAENACDFVLACFTYLLGQPYMSAHRVEERAVTKAAAQADDNDEDGGYSGEASALTAADAVRSKLSRNIIVPEGYVKINDSVYHGYVRLKTVKLPSTMLVIGRYAFAECVHLASIELPDSVCVIKQGAFSGCERLKTVKLPRGLCEIDDELFGGCVSLNEVDIPSSVCMIGAGAFSGCEELQRLNLPAGIKYIDPTAFSYCSELSVSCAAGSYAQRFCEEHDIEHVLVRR